MLKIIKVISFLTILSLIFSLGINFSLAQEETLPVPPDSQPAPANEPPAAPESVPAEIPALSPVNTGEPVAPEMPTEISTPAPPSPEQIQKIVEADISFTSQDLGVSDQRILPDSPLYPAKEAWREVKSFFTFGEVNQATRRLQYANEKMIEVKKLAEKTDDPNIITKALDNYKDELTEVRNQAADIKETATQNPEVDRFLEKFIDTNLKQQKLMDKLGKDLPDQAFDKMTEIKNEALNKFSEISLGVADPQKLEEKIIKVVEEQKGSDFKDFKNLEVLKQIEEKVPPAAKEALAKAQKNTLERLKNTIENISQEKKESFKDYVKNIPGHELRQMEIMHEFENERIAPEIRDLVEETKQLAIKRVEEKMMGFAIKPIPKEFLGHLEDGQMEDLRIIKELENNLAPEVIDKILTIKNKALDNMRLAIQNADTPEKQEEFFQEVEKFHDVKQLEMFKDMEKVVPPEKKEFFDKIKQKAMEEIKNEVAQAQEGREKTMVFEKLASDNPEGMAIMKEFGPPPEIMHEIMKEQVQKLSQRIETEQDAQKLQILKQRVQEEETVRQELEAKNPEIFRQIDEREIVLNQGMNQSTAQAQIDKAKEELAKAQRDYSATDQTMLQMSPASRLLEAAQKHISNAETALSEDKIGQAFGQATAALHEANSVRRIIKEISLRKEVGQKRMEELQNQYQQMMPPEQEPGPGDDMPPGDGQAPGEQPPESQVGGQAGGMMPPPDFGGIDMMRCPMPAKPERCYGPVIMKKDEQGCPQLLCSSAGGESGELPPESEAETGAPGPRPTVKPVLMPIPPGEERACVQVITPAKDPASGRCVEFPTPCDVPSGWIKAPECGIETPGTRPMPTILSPYIRPTPPSEILSPTTSPQPNSSAPQISCPREINPVCGSDNKTYTNACLANLAGAEIKANMSCELMNIPKIPEIPSFSPRQTLLEKIGASILLTWEGFLELIK